jgi:hypothetical protein
MKQLQPGGAQVADRRAVARADYKMRGDDLDALANIL